VAADTSQRGFTVPELSRFLRVGRDRVRRWIRAGELRAVNVASALCGKPRWIITPDALVEFERRRQAVAPPKPARRRRRQETMIDYFPD
jgi:hypothetical protein